MRKTAREVIARAVGNWEGNPGCRDEYLETADSILQALKDEGYEIREFKPIPASKVAQIFEMEADVMIARLNALGYTVSCPAADGE